MPNRVLPADVRQSRAQRPGLAPRDQARRLPAARGARRRPRTAVLPGRHDWTRRFPWIAETARKIRKTQFVLDGEAVVLGVDGISDFNALHSRRHDHEVQLYAFDCFAYDGDDLSRLPLTCARRT